MPNDTTIIDVDLAVDIRRAIDLNDDIKISDIDAKTTIDKAGGSDLIRVVKVIGSPIRIIKADVVTDDFLSRTLKVETQ